MNAQSLFRIVSRSRLMQMCFRNVSISRRHLCSIQLSSQTTGTSSTIHAPNIRLNHQEMTMRRFSSYFKHPAEFPSKKSDSDSTGASHNFSDEYIFSPNRHHDNNRTIFVGGLSKFTTVQSLYKHFLPFGTITGCSLARDKLTGISKDYGFVEFESVEQAKNTSEFHPHVIDDQEVNVRMGSMKGMQQKSKLFVGGLSKETSLETLREYFSKFGDVAECTGSAVKFWVLQVLADRPHVINGKMLDIFQKDHSFVIFVGNLPLDATDDLLNKTFSKYGKLVHWQVKRDHNTNRSLGYGFVSFEKAEQAVQAVNDGPHFMNGKTLKVGASKKLTLSKKSFK
ncbi:RNA recognition motif domain-containing protein [Ditylenchus destructor]|nr:RNA recognition motif domain-containing protein [Ditylenchus destructor]